MKPPKWLQENWFKLAFFFVLVFIGLGDGGLAAQVNDPGEERIGLRTVFEEEAVR